MSESRSPSWNATGSDRDNRVVHWYTSTTSSLGVNITASVPVEVMATFKIKLMPLPVALAASLAVPVNE